MNIRETLLEAIRSLIFISLIILFFYITKINLVENKVSLLIGFFMFFALYLPIYLNEKKYEKNRLHKIRKNKPFIKRSILGLLAGIHYLFFIGTYSHKKYNTQVFYPESIECWFGNLSQLLVFLIYLLVSIFIFKILSYYVVIVFAIPLIISFYSLTKQK